MLQQTQVKTVIPYFERWMQQLPTIASLAKASSTRIHKLWEGLGYYTRVRNLQKAAQAITKEHRGIFPQEFESVLALPGIGRYTAGAICSIAFNQPTPILDGNVMRVLARLYGIAGEPREKKTNEQLWKLAEDLVSAATGNCSRCNQALMELGALICTPRSPRCEVCPLKTCCVAFRENRVEQLPALSRRPRVTARRFMAFVLQHEGRFLVRQRPAKVVNAHLWEFPNVEIGANGIEARAVARRVLGCETESLKPLCVIKHSITRYRMTLEAFACASRSRRGSRRPNEAQEKRSLSSRRPPGEWLSRSQLLKLPFSSAHKKILQRLPGPGRGSMLARTPQHAKHSGLGKKGTGI